MITLKLAFWFMIKTLINSIRKSLKGILIFLGIFAFFIVIGFCGAMLFGGEESTGPDDSYTENQENEEGNEEEAKVNQALGFDMKEDGTLVLYLDHVPYDITNLAIQFVVGWIVLFFLVYGIYGGSKNGMSIFQMPDVNFLFPAPMKPQSVLLFRLIGQIGTTLVGSIYLIFQLPNIIINFKISVGAALMMFLTFLLLCIFQKFLSVLVYVVSNTYPRLKSYIKPTCAVLLLIPAVMVFYYDQIAGYNIVESLEMVFHSKVSYCIPFWGWFKAIIYYSIHNNITFVLVNSFAVCIGTALMIWITWQLRVDFYEDAITSATDNAVKQQKVENAIAGGTAYGVERKGRKARIWDKRRERSLSFGTSVGAKAFFTKTIGNRKRFYGWYGVLSSTASTYLTFGGSVAISFLLFKSSDGFIPVIIITAIIMFFRSFANPLDFELAVNFIRLVPEPPYKVLGWSVLGQVIDGAIDLAPIMVFSSIVLKVSPTTAILWYLVLVSMHMFYGCLSLMIDLLLGAFLPALFVNMCQIFLRMVPAIPLFLVLSLGILTGNLALALLGMVAIYLICSVLLFLPCPFFLHRGKR